MLLILCVGAYAGFKIWAKPAATQSGGPNTYDTDGTGDDGGSDSGVDGVAPDQADSNRRDGVWTFLVSGLDREGLHYEGTKDGEPFVFTIPSRQLPTYGMCTDVSRFYTFVDGEFCEFYPERESAELWMLATEELHRLNGGQWQDFPWKSAE